HARHNTSYWQGIPYLGIGPSAHSYNGTTRQWNVAHNPQYIKAIIEEEKIPYEQETLDLPTHYNEYIMTGLRTMWGISINRIKENYNKYFTLFSQELQRLIQEGLVKLIEDQVVLTRIGKLQADGVAARLFMV
ncbi:MAG TPA: coproporphyrinogen III oxidase, partial [Saprospiraceae bacterium]|nr:coproporphyrinogen III oxidase [Saprospiraceae bacterium]